MQGARRTLLWQLVVLARRNMHQSRDPRPGIVTQEEEHLLARLRGLLVVRDREIRITPARRDLVLIRENRRLIRDCITRLRQVRAGVPTLFLGLGQRKPGRSL